MANTEHDYRVDEKDQALKEKSFSQQDGKDSEIHWISGISIKTTNDKMLDKARKEFSKYKQPVSQIILSVQKENGQPVWRINFITKMFYLITIKLDAKTGELLSSEMHSLAK